MKATRMSEMKCHYQYAIKAISNLLDKRKEDYSFDFKYDARVPPLQTPVKTRTPFSPNELLCSSPPDTIAI